jgi:aspartate/methionine/tyrosine aminotransferase
VVNPNNPTGHFVKQEEAARLNEICSTRKMAVIADEVFLDFAHCETVARREGVKPPVNRAPAGKRAASFAANTGALTFTMSGLSKISGLPQMKAAWLVTTGPESL